MSKLQLVCGLMFVVGLVGGCGQSAQDEIEAANGRIVVCQQDAKICPDGTVLGREGEMCEFPACPGEAADSSN